MICTVEGIGLWGGGYSHWQRLQSNQNDVAEMTSAGPKPDVIPPRERRRAPLAVRIAVEVAMQAFENSSLQAEKTACVFASGMGDTSITDHMCRAVCTADKLLSPTKFHNSVHNAAAGYWTISTDCSRPANSVSAFQYTAALAMLESAIQCSVQRQPVLLVVFDIETPRPLAESMSIESAFAASLLLSPDTHSARPRLSFETVAATRESAGMVHPDDICVEGNNPASKLLPLLTRIARSDLQPVVYRTGTASGLSVQLMEST